MNQFLIILGTILILGSSIQAFQDENTLIPRPTQIQRLKKLVYILSDPKFNLHKTANDKDLDKIFNYIGDVRSMYPELRPARSVSEVIKEIAKRIKDVYTKIKEPFENISNKIKDFVAKLKKPFDKLFG